MAKKSETPSDQKRPYIATIITLIAFLLMCGLGIWQYDRGQHKQQRLERVQANQAQSTMTLQSLINLQTDKRDVNFSATGLLLTDNLIYLDNQIEAGKVGYQILLPLNTDLGLLLVNFGWIQAGQYRQQLPSVSLPKGVMKLSGTSYIPTINPMITETASANGNWPLLVQSIDLTFIGRALEQPVLPFVMQLDPAHPSGLVRNWQAVVMAPEKHYAYALQWFALAIASLIIYFVAFRSRKPTNHE